MDIFYRWGEQQPINFQWYVISSVSVISNLDIRVTQYQQLVLLSSSTLHWSLCLWLTFSCACHFFLCWFITLRIHNSLTRSLPTWSLLVPKNHSHHILLSSFRIDYTDSWPDRFFRAYLFWFQFQFLFLIFLFIFLVPCRILSWLTSALERM